MAEVKKTQNNSVRKDRWFSVDGITKEAKRVRWPKWKTEGNTPGILQNTGEVLTFGGFFALFFVCCDVLVAFLLRFIGIGV